MNMIHTEPYRLFNRGYNFNRLLNDYLPRVENDEAATSHSWSPAVDIKEQDNCYLIYADVPGINPADIDVSLEDGVLTIQGERQVDTSDESDGYKRMERVSGSFYRRFNLPDTADQNKISAQCKNGVLEVAIEKQEKLSAKKITVKS